MAWSYRRLVVSGLITWAGDLRPRCKPPTNLFHTATSRGTITSVASLESDFQLLPYELSHSLVLPQAEIMPSVEHVWLPLELVSLQSCGSD